MRKVSVLMTVVMLVAGLAVGLGTAKAQTSDDDLTRLKGLSGKDFDIAFMQMMTAHHQSAIEMAKLGATNAKHQEIKDLTGAIVTAQQQEITEMATWLKDWYNAPASAMSSMGNMAGEATNLSKLQGDEYDKQLMIDMIPHHQSAISMAGLVASRAEHTELKTMAQNIISSQSGEIEQMSGWLKQWYGLNAQGQPLVSAASSTNTADAGTNDTLPETGVMVNTWFTIIGLAGVVLLAGGLLLLRSRAKA